MASNSKLRLPTGALWTADAGLYEVIIVTADHGHVAQRVLARSIIAAHNIALRTLQEHGITDILFVKSVVLIQDESEIA